MAINLGWNKGLVTSLHESQIPEGAIARGEDFQIRDGTLRLDRRYIEKAAVAADDPQGSGWGKSGDDEEYLLVLEGSLYKADVGDELLFSLVTGGGSMAAGDWFFQQFGAFHYTVNEAAGIGRKAIGVDSFALLALPTAPTAAPSAVPVQPPYDDVTYVGGVVTNSGLASATVDAQGRLVCTSTSAGAKSVTITYDTSPDERPNHEYRDIVGFLIVALGYANNSLFPNLVVIEGATETQAIAWRIDPGSNMRMCRQQNIARSSRNLITAHRFEWDAPGNQTTLYIYPLRAWQVWLSLELGYNPGEGLPVLQPLEYEVTYYNETTGYESAPSPRLTVPAFGQSSLGEWRTLTAAVSTESGVSHVRFYRVLNEGGSEIRYRLASVANSGTPTYVDKLTVDEVRALPIYTPSIIPSGGPGAITAFQGRLAIAVGSLVYIGRSDDPIKFEPQSGPYDPYDPSRGLTFYPDDRQSEEVLSLIGQDDLYMVMDYSVRCLFGSNPDNWRLIKLPDTEGACGKRAAAPYKKGIVVLTPSGRLLYLHSSLAEPVDLSIDVAKSPGDAGLSEMASSDSCVSVSPEGEIWITNAAGRYYIRDSFGRWRRGRFAHGIHSHLFISGLPLRWIGSNGKLYEGGSDSFVSDGGTSGANGVAATFFAEPARSSHPRSSVRLVYIGDAKGATLTGYSQESPAGFPLVPTGSGPNLKPRPDSKPTGEWTRYRLAGTKDTIFDDVRVDLQQLSRVGQK